MSDDDIKDLLDSAAPDQPDLSAGARAGAVRDRARVVRRRNGLVLAAAAVVAVVGIAAVTSGDDPGPGTGFAGDPSTSEPTRLPPPACPTEPVDVSDPIAVDALPDGAISARACPAVWTGPGSSPDLPPDTLTTDPLVGGVDYFTSEVRAISPYESADDCALISVVPTPWAIVVSYPDATSATLSSTTTICSSVSVEGVDRDVDAIRSLFNDAFDKVGELPADPTDGIGGGIDLDCPSTPSELGEILGTADTADLDVLDPVTGVVCYVADPLGSPAYAEEQGVLTPDQARVLAADLKANTTSRPTVAGRCTDSGPTRVVALYAQDGTGVVRLDSSCTTEFAGGGFYWKAGEEAEAVIDQALGGRVDG